MSSYLWAGIYAIRNIETRKIYIGKTGGFRDRWATHLSHLKKGCHINTGLRNEFSEYGVDAFRFSVLVDGPGDPIESLWHKIALERITRATNEPATLQHWHEAFLMRAIPNGFAYNEQIPRAGRKSYLDACLSVELYNREFEEITAFCEGSDDVQYIYDAALNDYGVCHPQTSKTTEIYRTRYDSLNDTAERARVYRLLQDEIKQTKEFRKRVYEHGWLYA